jgi:hypothetical protein
MAIRKIVVRDEAARGLRPETRAVMAYRFA